MIARLAAGLLACGLLAGTALADPITVKDDAGRSYQLNDDGTYAIVTKGPDGKTYLLHADGTWGDEFEDASLSKRFSDMMTRVFTTHAPDLVAEDIPKYEDCLLKVFNGMPRDARRVLLSSDDPEIGFKALEAKYPDVAKMLDGSDDSCRHGLKSPDSDN